MNGLVGQSTPSHAVSRRLRINRMNTRAVMARVAARNENQTGQVLAQSPSSSQQLNSFPTAPAVRLLVQGCNIILGGVTLFVRTVANQ